MYYVRIGDELLKSKVGKVHAFTDIKSAKEWIKEHKLYDTIILKSVR